MIPHHLKEQFDAASIGTPTVQEPTTAPPTTVNRRRGDRKVSKGKTGERFKVLNTFVDFTMQDLSRNEITVWMILYRDSSDGISQTSVADLARRGGTSERNTKRAIRSLEKRQLLKIIHRGGLRKGASKYWVRPLSSEAL